MQYLRTSVAFSHFLLNIRFVKDGYKEQGFSLYKFSIVIKILLCSVLLHTNGYSQTFDTQNRNIYEFQNLQTYHPDGTVGKISFNIGLSYLSIKNQPGQPVVDAQSYQAGIGLVLVENFSLWQSLKLINEFETVHKLSFGFNFYISNPIQKNININPDGKIGSPVISAEAIMLFDNYDETESLYNYKAKILLPLSKSFSVFGGTTSYQEITSKDVDKFFGGINLFFSSYNQTNIYINPDSPPLGMALSLFGGSSEFGSFGQIELAIPASESITVKISSRADLLEAPHDKIYTGSASFIYYAGK